MQSAANARANAGECVTNHAAGGATESATFNCPSCGVPCAWRPEIVGKTRIGDIRHCFCDTSLAADKLNFRAIKDFEEGLAELAEWVAQQTAVDRVDQAKGELEARGLVA